MNLTARFITSIIRLLLKMICSVEGVKLESVPWQGPLILVVNHINFLDVPLIYTLLHPRNICAIVKKETWNNWFLKILAIAWGAIPINREKPSIATFKEVGKALQEKKILCIAPEGTRSGTGVLRKGYQGVVFLALQNRVPILIVAHYGAEKFWYNIRRLKRTGITFVVGKPFLLASTTRMNKKVYQEMTNQIMTRLASMLPANYRGEYKDIEIISDQFIQDE